LFSLPDACQVIVVLVVSLKQTRAFRSMSIIAIVALIAGPIERRHDESSRDSWPTLTGHYTGAISALIMCGRFTATFEFSDIRVRWNLERDLPTYTPRFNIAPETSPNIPVIVRHKGGNECRLMHWGLIPHWAADPSIGNRMINARAETLTELPSFKLLVDRRRCIISR
jgi:hypothetical protein